MRQFASRGFRLWQLGVPAKLIYTVFCGFMLLGLLSSILYGIDLMGPTAEGAVRYYRGQPASPAPAAPAATAPRAGGGPAMELPPDEASPTAAITTLHVGIPYRKLLEVSHFHLFTVPVVLLILAHLFMLTDLQERTKVAWIAVSSVAAFGHIAAPWILRYGPSGLGWLMPVTGVAMLATMTVLTIYPVIAMWAGGGRRRGGGAVEMPTPEEAAGPPSRDKSTSGSAGR
jgi:hypothetical protein